MCHFHSQPKQQMMYRTARVAAVEDQLHRGIPAGDIGQTVVRLPASFVGSARFYQQLYLDALALPRRFGKPDLFITVTCNPKWPEIGLALPAGAKWQDHPDIVSRVFMLKLKCIIDDFKNGQIFGVLKAFVYRIEWQARGLPHAHMLLILEHKIMTAAQIDAIVSAEMPDPVAQPVLFALVGAHMLHPRCDVHPHSPCPPPFCSPLIALFPYLHVNRFRLTRCDVVLQQEKHSCRADTAGHPCDCRRRFPKDMELATVIIGESVDERAERNE
jgi:hypothetical protein